MIVGTKQIIGEDEQSLSWQQHWYGNMQGEQCSLERIYWTPPEILGLDHLEFGSSDNRNAMKDWITGNGDKCE